MAADGRDQSRTRRDAIILALGMFRSARCLRIDSPVAPAVKPFWFERPEGERGKHLHLELFKAADAESIQVSH